MDNKKQESIQCLNKYVNIQYATLIEQSILLFATTYAEYNDVLEYLDNIYDTKLNELLTILEDNPNIISSEDDAKNIAFMKPEELNPDTYEQLLKKKELEEYNKTDIKSSSAFKCSKCKKNKCSVTQKQTRAGDEPATIFVTCLECGYNFSFN